MPCQLCGCSSAPSCETGNALLHDRQLITLASKLLTSSRGHRHVVLSHFSQLSCLLPCLCVRSTSRTLARPALCTLLMGLLARAAPWLSSRQSR